MKTLLSNSCFALVSLFGVPALAQSSCYEELANVPFAGPEAPAGKPAKNWIKTLPGKG
jgi:hypothetical protein